MSLSKCTADGPTRLQCAARVVRVAQPPHTTTSLLAHFSWWRLIAANDMAYSQRTLWRECV